jgi:hypothetical protein
MIYTSCHVIRFIKGRRMRWAGHTAHMGQKRTVCKILVGKPEGKRSLGRLWHRREDNIKTGLKEIIEQDMD